MAGSPEPIFEAIERWSRKGLIDSDTAARLDAEVRDEESRGTKRLAQYVLATTGAVVLVLAGAVFLDWAWPLLSGRNRGALLSVGGVGAVALGVHLEGQRRWRPAAYLLQTSGLLLILSAWMYLDEVVGISPVSSGIVGFLALCAPIVLAPRAMRRNVVMPAVHLALAPTFLAVYLEQVTELSTESIIWVLDGIFVVAIVALWRLMRDDPEGVRYPWALNAFATAMAGGFVLVVTTAAEALDFVSEGVLLSLDAWLALCAGLTLWGIHRAPSGLRRGWFDRLIALEMFAWIVFGLVTVEEIVGGADLAPEVGIVVVGGMGVLAFLHADRSGLRELMAAASLALIVPIWWWAVERAGALGGVGALVATAAFLFWASGRRGAPDPVPEETRDP